MSKELNLSLKSSLYQPTIVSIDEEDVFELLESLNLAKRYMKDTLEQLSTEPLKIGHREIIERHIFADIAKIDKQISTFNKHVKLKA